MSKFTMIHAWTWSAALLTCVACGGAPAPSEADATDPTGTTDEGSGAGRVLEPPRESQPPLREAPTPERVEAPELSGAVGTLSRRFSRVARESVCVTFGRDQLLTAIDELACSFENEGIVCGSCPVELRPAAIGGWILTAQPGAVACDLIGGTYLLGSGDDARACSATHGQPCGDGFCPVEEPVCVQDILGRPACVG